MIEQTAPQWYMFSQQLQGDVEHVKVALEPLELEIEKAFDPLNTID